MLDAEDGGATWPGNVQVSASTGSSYNGYTQIIKPLSTAGTWLKVELPLTGVASPFDPSPAHPDRRGVHDLQPA